MIYALTLILLAVVTVGLSYLIARKRLGLWWGVLAYSVGLIGTFVTLIAALVLLNAFVLLGTISRQQMGEAELALSAMAIALLGPAIGLWLARRRISN